MKGRIVRLAVQSFPTTGRNRWLLDNSLSAFRTIQDYSFEVILNFLSLIVLAHREDDGVFIICSSKNASLLFSTTHHAKLNKTIHKGTTFPELNALKRFHLDGLTSGQGACPPEDVGGVDGLADMLTSLAGPEDEKRKSYLKWLGRDFDPEFFDLHELQNRVDDFQRVIGEARWGFYHK